MPRRYADVYFGARDAINMCAPLGELWGFFPDSWLPLGEVAHSLENALLPERAVHNFFSQLAHNASSWPAVSTLVDPELVLTYWLRGAHRVPIVDSRHLSRTRLVKVREDGARVVSDEMWA